MLNCSTWLYWCKLESLFEMGLSTLSRISGKLWKMSDMGPVDTNRSEPIETIRNSAFCLSAIVLNTKSYLVLSNQEERMHLQIEGDWYATWCGFRSQPTYNCD
jgi:hypothetical protein